MSFEWIHENPPYWDADKARVVADAPEGIFHLGDYKDRDLLPGEWWRVEEGGTVLGYGWMDCTWGDAEMLLVVDPSAQKRGVGTFILDRMETEASARGLNYLYNVVLATHPDRAGTAKWLMSRGFEKSHDDESLRRRVKKP